VSRLEIILFTAGIILYTILAVFTYSYVDLNLTLSQNPIFLSFAKTMQQLGYYNRPIAALVYLTLVIFTFSFFILNLWLFYRSKVSLKYLKVLLITNSLILIFAYPFLSSDIFNYMFDAKIILTYHANPYTHKPLDFPNDEWLRFMRWIHRYSPYGPLWLGYSLIPAVLGFGKFILNLLTFKLFIAVFHTINAYLIYKISQKINPKKSIFWTATYALNPLFLIEGVANAHNDILVATLLLLSVYFVSHKKNVFAILSLIFGTLIKYIPVINIPWIILPILRKDPKKYILASLISLSLFTYFFSSFKITVPFVSSGATQVQFQPWYLFWTLPYVSLLGSISLLLVTVSLSIGSSLRYLPYLYYGDWSHFGTNNYLQFVTVVPLLISVLFALIIKVFKR